MTEDGGGASKSTEPAAGTSAATDVSLREHLAGQLHDAQRRIDERDRYLREADRRFDEERDRRYQEQREADRRLLEERQRADAQALYLQRQVDQEHFAHLNEAAARSIEERAHFATRELVDALKETFATFKEDVNTRLDTAQGQSRGIGLSASVLISAVGLVATVGAIIALVVGLR